MEYQHHRLLFTSASLNAGRRTIYILAYSEDNGKYHAQKAWRFLLVEARGTICILARGENKGTS